MDLLQNKELVKRFANHPLTTGVLVKGHKLGVCCRPTHWQEALEKSTSAVEIGALLDLGLKRNQHHSSSEILEIYLSYADGWRAGKFVWRGEKGIKEELGDRDFGALGLCRKAFLALCRYVWQNDRSENGFLHPSRPSWTFNLSTAEIERILDFLIDGNFPQATDIRDYPEMASTQEFVLDLYHEVFAHTCSSEHDWKKDEDGQLRSKLLRLVAQEMPRELIFLMIGDVWERVTDKHEVVLRELNKEFNRGEGLDGFYYQDDLEFIPRVSHFLRGVKKSRARRIKNEKRKK